MSAAGIFKATSPNVKASGTPSSNLLPDEAGHKNATLQITSGTNNTGIQECFLAGTLVLKRGILTIPLERICWELEDSNFETHSCLSNIFMIPKHIQKN